MPCKNCQIPLVSTMNYCHACGAKVVRAPITFRTIWSNTLSEFLGWDSRFFQTVYFLIRHPERVLLSYLDGVRRRYTRPIVFLAIATALASLCFGYFAEQLISNYDIIWQENFANTSTVANPIETGMAPILLKYFNQLTLLVIPLYALVSFIMFRSALSYGEHLVLNAYIQGFLMIAGIILFITSILLDIQLYSIGFMPVNMVYYFYCFKRMGQYSNARLVLKFILFIGLVILGSTLLGLAFAFLMP